MKIFYIFLMCSIAMSLHALEIFTPYGNTVINEPVLQELIQCSAMQRLKKIHQYGVTQYIKPKSDYSRYEHSIGVFFLVRAFDGSLLEQIAALLHDVSHTVFSHVGDQVFKYYNQRSSYQDSIHLNFLLSTEIPEILQKYGISIEEIDHKNGSFSMLEQDLPEICADRLEYILYGGFIENRLSFDEIRSIVASLDFIDSKWIFYSLESARKLAYTALYLNEYIFGSSFNNVTYHVAAKALRRAIKIGSITLYDIHHATDLVVWDTLSQSEDQKIKKLMHMLQHCDSCYRCTNAHEAYDVYTQSKFRGIDPWVKINDVYVRLTEIDAEFAKSYSALKDRMQQGMYIQFIN